MIVWAIRSFGIPMMSFAVLISKSMAISSSSFTSRFMLDVINHFPISDFLVLAKSIN